MPLLSSAAAGAASAWRRVSHYRVRRVPASSAVLPGWYAGAHRARGMSQSQPGLTSPDS
ncbi:hypothetical protein BJ981_000243 [Sphaerisporangium krabiense]|uniref:Uncharacterized protein n=1 Tax=Sphaerisporangium krabiense TaxID=763782 RepID=A0A7W8YZ97_9ACTN|nr:hypothetical protein [Sphaerisporangium krabiense]